MMIDMTVTCKRLTKEPPEERFLAQPQLLMIGTPVLRKVLTAKADLYIDDIIYHLCDKLSPLNHHSTIALIVILIEHVHCSDLKPNNILQHSSYIIHKNVVKSINESMINMIHHVKHNLKSNQLAQSKSIVDVFDCFDRSIKRLFVE